MSKSRRISRRETSAARLASVQGLYELEITKADLDKVFLEFLERRWKEFIIEHDDENHAPDLAEADKDKFSQIIRGVRENIKHIDRILYGSFEKDRNFKQLDVLLKVILRAAVFELFFLTSVPARVVINEYVELAHAFYSENEPYLVNGILDKIGKSVRQKELNGL